LAVSFRLAANTSERWLRMRADSIPISTAQAAPMNPTIPHVARMWDEPRSSLPLFTGVFNPSMMAPILRTEMISLPD
jgi:hypothetical protein